MTPPIIFDITIVFPAPELVYTESNSAASSNANVANFVDEFLASLPESSAGNDVNFLGEGGVVDETNTTTPPSRPLFTVASPFGPVGDNDSPDRADTPRGFIFPSTIPMIKKRFFNQNSELNNDGYDSEGGLPFFADNQVDDAVEYFEAPLEDYDEGPQPAAPSTPAPAAVATEQLTIERMMSLKMKELKEELRKRGRSMVGKKGVLQDRLREAILLIVPVAFGNEARHHESMSGLDVMSQWVLLKSLSHSRTMTLRQCSAFTSSPASRRLPS